MPKFIQGWIVTCPECQTVNRIIEENLRYPARIQEIIYCAKCHKILGYKNSTVSLDTEIDDEECKHP